MKALLLVMFTAGLWAGPVSAGRPCSGLGDTAVGWLTSSVCAISSVSSSSSSSSAGTLSSAVTMTSVSASIDGCVSTATEWCLMRWKKVPGATYQFRRS